MNLQCAGIGQMELAFDRIVRAVGVNSLLFKGIEGNVFHRLASGL